MDLNRDRKVKKDEALLFNQKMNRALSPLLLS